MIPKHVLVIDDDPRWSSLLKARLGPQYKFHTAETIKNFERLLDIQDLSLVITNWNLAPKGGFPDNLGVTVIDKIRDKHPALPCIIITGSEQYAQIQKRSPEAIVIRKMQEDFNKLSDIVRRIVESGESPLFLRLARKLRLENYQLHCLLKHPSVIEIIENVQVSSPHISDLEAFNQAYRLLDGKGFISKAILEARRIKLLHDQEIREWRELKRKVMRSLRTFEMSLDPLTEKDKKRQRHQKELLWKIQSKLGEFASSSAVTNGETSITLPDSEDNKMEKYIDFELYVDSTGLVRARSEEGERTAKISLNITDDIELAVNLIKEKRKASTELLKSLGKKLYNLAFPDQIQTHFHQTEAIARKENRKVRIRLAIQPDILACLPWEFIYREELGYFFATNPGTVLSRYLNLPLPQNYVRRQSRPLHMLVIIANPSDQAVQLNPDKWEGIITKALIPAREDGLITIETVKHATYERINEALLAQPPDIVQFVGHGIYQDGKGYLALVDSNSDNTWIVGDERFANIFLGSNDHLGLVCLATCKSATSNSPKSFLGIAPQIIQRGVPAVVAMQYSVLVSTAEIFLENFYQAVAARKPIDWAVQHARNAISIKQKLNNREFATPVLFMRAKDGNIF
jgi:CheY-like chemotaxis protein